MSQSYELDPATQEAIEAHCAKGDELAADGRFEDAIAEYRQAWDLLPEPQND